MNFERLVKKPRDSIYDIDTWVRLQVFSLISKEPVLEDFNILEELLNANNPIMAFLAHQALTKLFPMPSTMKRVWHDLFQETVELLEKRASSNSGSAQIRTAATKALAFTSDLSFSTIESVLKSLTSAFTYEKSFITPEPFLSLIPQENNFYLSEAFGILLASMPIEQEDSLKILKRELDCQNSDRLIPALISLQINPSPEMTDQLLWIARHSEKRVADEAVRALLACGNKKVYLVISSLLKEVRDIDRLAAILPVVAATDREEIWPDLVKFAKSEEKKIVLTVLKAIDGYTGTSKNNKIALYSEIVSKNKDPNILALAALLAWRAGSHKSIKILKQLLDSDKENYRLASVSTLAEFPSDKAIPILISHFDNENDENIIDHIFLSLRNLFPKVKKEETIDYTVIPWLERMLKSSNASYRNQAAVLCGYLGHSTEDILINSLSKESHPYVIASILSALGKCGSNKLIIFSKFHDHNDSRVRANMIYALSNCGNEATPYFYEALNDNSPRVRAGAAYNLFLLGQLNSIKVLNDMLQVPEPLSVLSASYVLYNIFKIIIPKLEADHPLALAISNLSLIYQRNKPIGPGLLNSPEAPDLFNEMASANGDRKKLLWLLEDKHKRRPSSFLITRLLAAMYILCNENAKALPLMEICVRENPSDLADLLDAYRTVLKLGDLTRSNELGEKTQKLYKMLLDGCIELCKGIRGSGAALMLQRLNFLAEPSMNLYNAMIQLKVVEDDLDTVMYLMTELILARPFNINLINKLSTMMPDEYSDLKEALVAYSNSILE